MTNLVKMCLFEFLSIHTHIYLSQGNQGSKFDSVVKKSLGLLSVVRCTAAIFFLTVDDKFLGRALSTEGNKKLYLTTHFINLQLNNKLLDLNNSSAAH